MADLILVRRMRRQGMIVSAAVVLLVGILAAKVMLNPLRRSEGDVQKWLLTQAPLGSTREQVLAVAARRGWKLHPEYRGRFINGSVPVGGFGAELGTYTGLLNTKVDAYWRFSVTDKLVEVYVNKWGKGFEVYPSDAAGLSADNGTTGPRTTDFPRIQRCLILFSLGE